MEENEDDQKVINHKTEHEETDEEEIDTQVQNATRVDLTRIKSGYKGKLHSQSNLPNVLNEYGMEEKENKYKESRKTHKERQSKKTAKEPEETDSKEKRRKKREERYLQLMEERQSMPEGSQYFSKKVSHMMTRLNTPREGNTHHGEPDDSQKQEKPILKKKMEKHVLTTNSDYLKDMPKSDIAKIVELQDKLMKEGKLKTHYDIDKFREDIKKPEVFNSYFKNAKTSDTGSVVGSTISLPKVQPPNPRALGHIAEASRPPTREEWAVTHQFAPKYEETKAMTSKKQGISDQEKRFPKPQMPPLKCFAMDLGEKPADPEEIQRQAELKVRIKQRKKFLRKLHRMHQMAMAHSAAASRIMENHGEIGGILDGNSLRDVASMYSGIQNFISVLPAPEDQYISQQDVEVAEIGGQLMQDDHSRGSSSNGSFRSRATLHSRGSLASRGSQQSRGSKSVRTPGLRRRLQSRESNRTKAPPLPLTMDEIRGKTKVIEAKCLSSNWMNYMKSGTNIETS
ncbi:uncharacterized protein LOC117327776 isoform X2 [Pecten maximus]|uniref:uncharacterized protein LOC117327776 isoform X2 n=1 Tax=Pecten maximus TaxID=6579 RepID=UPI0014582E94|nr:uncharacterized protein LOC117327776 isoform X2 [Pecten maximus]